MKNGQLHPPTEISGSTPSRATGRAGFAGRAACAAGLLFALLAAGCQTVHTVTVDAISHPQKKLGESYRLEVHDPSGGVDTELQARAVAAIKDTLAARGLYEAPEGAKPDSVITYTYGVGHGRINIVTQQNTDLLLDPRIAPQATSKAVVVFDKFIELSAREVSAPPDAGRPGAPARGEEMWNIKATIVDTKKELDAYLASLATACIDYIGENSGKELHFKIEPKAAREILRQRTQSGPPVKVPAK